MAIKAAVTIPALPTRIPTLALLLSLLWPGLGQVYNGQIRKGILLMLLYVMSLLLISASPIGFFTTALLLVYGVVNARSVAEYYKHWIGGPQQRCPKCGASVQAATDSCRFCGTGWRGVA